VHYRKKRSTPLKNTQPFQVNWSFLFGGCLASAYFSAQQVGQRDAPPVGGFEVRFFIKVWWLRLASASGAPLTVTLGFQNHHEE